MAHLQLAWLSSMMRPSSSSFFSPGRPPLHTSRKASTRSASANTCSARDCSRKPPTPGAAAMDLAADLLPSNMVARLAPSSPSN